MFTFGTVKAWTHVSTCDYEIDGYCFDAEATVRGEYTRDDDCDYREWEPQEVEITLLACEKYDPETDSWDAEYDIPKKVMEELEEHLMELSYDCELDWEEKW